MKFRNFGKGSRLISMMAGLLLLNSCAGMLKYQPYARNVQKKPGRSGIIALRLEHRQEDRDHAQSLMVNNCGQKKVQVTDEGEVVIGTVTNSSTQSRKGGSTQMGSLFGLPVTSSSPDSTNQSSTTTQKKEWQIKYNCA